MQEEKENEIDKRCSFKPQINEFKQVQRSISPIESQRKGFNRYLERQQHESLVS